MSEYPEKPADLVESAEESLVEEKKSVEAGVVELDVEREMRRLSRRSFLSGAAAADGAGWRRGAKTTGLHGRCAALTKSTNSWRAIISAEHGYLPPFGVNWRGNRAQMASSGWGALRRLHQRLPACNPQRQTVRPAAGTGRSGWLRQSRNRRRRLLRRTGYGERAASADAALL